MRVALLTGGGDAPGLNGIIESTGKSLLRLGHQVIGIEDGFEGIYSGRFKELKWNDFEGLHQQAGTVLGTSNKSGTTGRESEFLKKYLQLNADVLIAAGGDGTFAGLKKFEKDIPMIGVPKTIDNDLSGTDITFGFDTACTVVAETVDALRATADAHRRVLVVETMGRTAGWIALGGGLSSYADVILIPERPYNKELLLQYINEKKKTRRGLMVVVSESAHAENAKPNIAFEVKDSPQKERYGGVGEKLARWIEQECAWESRHVVLGHLQRSRAPTVTDRFLTMSMGIEVAKLVSEKKWGQAVVYREGRVQSAPVTDLMMGVRCVKPDHRWVKMAESLGIFI